MADLPTNPTVRAFVTAINTGDRDAFDSLLAPGAAMSDDGTDRNLDSWVDQEIFSAEGRMDVESESDDGRALIARFTNSSWGTMRTRWHFTINDGTITRFDTGQA
ncbi:nuclear transport factor 2 family protein [Amycolatopsis aidingensis]|uniref:nuclear transport factor 2 family protein n=1 Tax=Amycolatopsis aidingensis TaxID=2842453 RepID=UPI001C0E3CE0|nr:nuclear transport factor 2 family protein [Amycolatopsis aidingensis]